MISDKVFKILDNFSNQPKYHLGSEAYSEIKTVVDGKVNRIVTLV